MAEKIIKTEPNLKEKARRLSRSKRHHVRRMKQEARSAGTVYKSEAL